jgi:hypothetical protein
MRIALFALIPAVLLCSACHHETKSDDGPAPSDSNMPGPTMSAFVSALDGATGPPPGAEKEAGRRLAEGAPKSCPDMNCRFRECQQLCAGWVGQNYRNLPLAGEKNRLFFGCISGCIHANEDGGTPASK